MLQIIDESREKVNGPTFVGNVITATVDRIEGEVAVLFLCGNTKVTFNLPVVFLAGIHEGDVVDITITKDAAATDEAKERVTGLIEKLKRKG